MAEIPQETQLDVDQVGDGFSLEPIRTRPIERDKMSKHLFCLTVLNEVLPASIIHIASSSGASPPYSPLPARRYGLVDVMLRGRCFVAASRFSLLLAADRWIFWPRPMEVIAN